MRVDVRVADPNCPVRDTAVEADAPTDAVARSTGASRETVVEEFRLAAGAPKVERGDHDALTEVFAYADQHVYRFEREADRPCFCEAVEGFDRPVSNLHANNGYLYASFHALESEGVSTIVRSLHDAFDITLQRIVYADSGESEDLVIFDRSKLTERQLDAIRAAHEQGYFEEPKESNADDVAASLGISRSTFHHHLTRAQSKLLDAVLDDAPERSTGADP